MGMDSMGTKGICLSEFTKEFLLKEYERIHSLKMAEDHQVEQRVTFFLTISSAAGAGISFFLRNLQSGVPKPGEMWAIRGILIILLFWGMGILGRLATRTVQQEAYNQLLARIRGFVACCDADIAAYLDLYAEQVKRKPRSRLLSIFWNRLRGDLVGFMLLANGVITGGIALTVRPSVDIWENVGLVSGGFLVSIALLQLYYYWMKKHIDLFKF